MGKIKDSSNNHIYMLDHTNTHCGGQTDGEESKSQERSKTRSNMLRN